MDFSANELRMLRYLDQCGPTHRHKLAGDLANLRNRPYWPQALTRIAGKMTARLRKHGFVRESYDSDGNHLAYTVTPEGRKAVRN